MPEDARSRYSRHIIRETFLALLTEKTLDKISVSELCRLAGINRTTFYKYYENPFDLMSKLEQELLDSLSEKIRALPAREFGAVIRIITAELDAERTAYRVLFSEQGDRDFRNRVLSLCHEENRMLIAHNHPYLSEIQKEWLYCFIVEGTNGILRTWINGNTSENPEMLASFSEKIVEAVRYGLGPDRIE